MQKKRHTIIPEAYVIFKVDDKILMLLRKNTGYQDGKYSFPAGHVEEGETPIQAAIREAKEEVNLSAKKEDLTLAHVLFRIWPNEPERVGFFFLCKKWQGIPKNAEPQKHGRLLWCDIKKPPQNTIPYILLALKNIQNQIVYHELRSS